MILFGESVAQLWETSIVSGFKILRRGNNNNRSCYMVCLYVCFFFSSCCKGMVTAMALSIASNLGKNPAKEIYDLDKMKVITVFPLLLVCYEQAF